MLGAACAHKFVAFRHLAPAVHRLEGAEIEGEALCGFGPARVEIGVERPGVSHDAKIEKTNSRLARLFRITTRDWPFLPHPLLRLFT